VKGDEGVAFVLIDPLHYDEEREVIVPEAFRELTKRDLSLIRIDHATKAEAESVRNDLIARGLARAKPQTRSVNEACITKASSIRSELEDGKRLLGVFDTALDDKTNHASVFTTEAVLNNKRLRKVAVNRIHSIMTKDRIAFTDLLNTLKD